MRLWPPRARGWTTRRAPSKRPECREERARVYERPADYRNSCSDTQPGRCIVAPSSSRVPRPTSFVASFRSLAEPRADIRYRCTSPRSILRSRHSPLSLSFFFLLVDSLHQRGQIEEIKRNRLNLSLTLPDGFYEDRRRGCWRVAH